MSIFQISTAVYYCVFFYLGGYLYCKHRGNGFNKDLFVGWNKQNTTLKEGFTWTVISIGGFAISGILNDYNEIIVKLVRYGLDMFVSIAGVLMVYYLTQGFEFAFKKLSKTKTWNRIDRDSFGIYLFHQQIIYLTIIPLNGHVHPVLQVILSFLIAICISEVIVMLFRRCKMTKALFGL